MGRVFFPTYRANVIGVREVGAVTQLGGLDGRIPIPRAPAEPYPRAANNPTDRMLGAAMIMANGDGVLPGPAYRWDPIIARGPIVMPGPQPTPPAPSLGPVSPANPPTINLPPGAPPNPPAIPAPPVSAQNSPTPVVTMPPASGAPMLITSGGGSPTPATAPITIQTGDSTTSAITAWLQGSTTIFSYAVPNVALAITAALAFAWLSSGSGKRR